MADIDYVERRKSLIEKTRLRLEEWTRGEDTDFLLEEDAAMYPIVKYIDEYLDEAAWKVLVLVPNHRLSAVAADFPLSTFNVVDGIGYIDLPSDYVKVFGIKMKRWERELTLPLKATDDDYKIQMHAHTRGIHVKPMIAVAFGKLELYSCKDTDTSSDIEEAKYIKRIAAERMPSEFDELLTLICASIVEKVFGNIQQQQVFDQQIQLMLEMNGL